VVRIDFDNVPRRLAGGGDDVVRINFAVDAAVVVRYDEVPFVFFFFDDDAFDFNFDALGVGLVDLDLI